MHIQRFFLLKSLIVLGVAGVFGKIYQQNYVIGLQYEKQRLERQYQQLTKKRNAVLVELTQAKDYAALKLKAEQQYGMAQLQLSHLVTYTGALS